jgi:hypothetical protein
LRTTPLPLPLPLPLLLPLSLLLLPPPPPPPQPPQPPPLLLLLLRKEAKENPVGAFTTTFAATFALGLLVEGKFAGRSRPIDMHRDKLCLLGRLHRSIGLDPSHEASIRRLGDP